MSNKFNRGNLLDFESATASPVSGAILGVTPKVSAWIKVKNTDSVTFTFTTTGTADGSWKVELSNDEAATKVNVVDRANLIAPPTLPTGTLQNSTVAITTLGYAYLRLTFTPVGGAGNADAQTGVIVGKPVDLAQVSLASAFIYVPAAGAAAGSWLMETSNDWSGIGAGTTPRIADGQWTDIIDAGDPAIASVAGSGQKLSLRLGFVEQGALRISYTPASGFGALKVFFVGKGA
ncbi:MAG TPA: hypothetical protein VFI42_15895 [Thermomicrobiaceae bacterium]|nr:hypothetical protein [Thermomicrobiaceae bacterium]